MSHVCGELSVLTQVDGEYVARDCLNETPPLHLAFAYVPLSFDIPAERPQGQCGPPTE